MDHKHSVLIQIDLDGRYVRLQVAGCLTEANQHVLYSVVHRAHAVVPSGDISVDLTAACHVEAAAVDLLRWELNHDRECSNIGPVQVLVPANLPDHAPDHARDPGHPYR